MNKKCIVLFLFASVTSASSGMDEHEGYSHLQDLQKEIETNRQKLCGALRECREGDDRARSCTYQKSIMQKKALQFNSKCYFNTHIMNDIQDAIERSKIRDCAIVNHQDGYLHKGNAWAKVGDDEIRESARLIIMYVLPGQSDAERDKLAVKGAEICGTKNFSEIKKMKILFYVPDESQDVVPQQSELQRSDEKPQHYTRFLSTGAIIVGGISLITGLLYLAR